MKEKNEKIHPKKNFYIDISSEIKKNFGLYSIIFSGVWFLLTLYVKTLIRLFISGYYSSLKLDSSYFYYNDENITICMFYAAMFLIVLTCIILLFCIIKINIIRTIICLIGSGISWWGERIIPSEENMYIFVLKVFIGIIYIVFFFLTIISYFILFKIKIRKKYIVSFIVVFSIVTILISCLLVYKAGENIISNNSSFEIAYINDENNDNYKYYIVLWKKDSKICMREIEYESGKKNLIVPKENQLVIGDNEAKYYYFSQTFESVKIEEPEEPTVMMNMSLELQIPEWQFEFITLDDGIEYVAERKGSNPLYLHKYTMESIGEQKYIVINYDEYIMIDREKIKQSRCVNSRLRERENGTIWKIIDYRDFQKLLEKP